MKMTKEEFKRRWEKDENGDGITNDDCADCYEAWGLGSKPRCKPMRSVINAVVRAAGCEAEPDPEPENCATKNVGNAAAMREALEGCVHEMCERCDSYMADNMQTHKPCPGCVIVDKARAALAAPARNCDRFKTLDEAREAFQDLRGHKILADVELWDSMDEAGALVRWLFAPAKGKETDNG